MNQSFEILLVEDSMDDAQLAIRALKKSNLANSLLHLEDGQEAINYLLDESNTMPRLVLLDLKMPKVDGLEVLRVLKSNEKRKMIPVVMLTSSKEESDIMKSYKLGVNAYIVKPVDFDQFMKAVTELGLFWLTWNQVPERTK